MSVPLACPNCLGRNLYTRRLDAGGTHGPNLLEGLKPHHGPEMFRGNGWFTRMGQFDVVVCADCGLTRLFAEPKARAMFAGRRKWKRLDSLPDRLVNCPTCGYDLRASPDRCPECGSVP